VLAAFDPLARPAGPGIPAGVCLGGSWPFFVEGASLADLLRDPAGAANIFYSVNDRVGSDFVTVGTGATALLFQALGAKVVWHPRRAPSIDSTLAANPGGLARLDPAGALESEGLAWLKAVARETVRLNVSNRAIFVSGRAPFTLAGQLCELEMLTRALYKDKPFVEALLAFALELTAGYFDAMLAIPGIDGIFIADPSASGDVLSAAHFRNWALPWTARLTTRLARWNKPILLHVCGKITDRLEQISLSGAGMISLDAKVGVGEARAILGGRLAFAGNVDPVGVLEDMDPGGVCRESKLCLDKAGAGRGGFMLLPGCDLSARAPEPNVLAFVRAAHEYEF
jgi:uroporphyrinogen decarboxylase